MRLLIVEDVAAVGRATARLLRSYGYTVAAVTSYLEASSVAGHFECAIIDLALPDGSGVDLARRLLSAGRVGQVIFYSATLEASEQLAAEAFGVFVHKLDGIGTLLQRVSEAQRRAEQQRQRRALAVGETPTVSGEMPRFRTGVRLKRPPGAGGSA